MEKSLKVISNLQADWLQKREDKEYFYVKTLVDGANNNFTNQDFCDVNDIELILTRLRVLKRRYDLILAKQNSIVKCLTTNDPSY